MSRKCAVYTQIPVFCRRTMGHLNLESTRNTSIEIKRRTEAGWIIDGQQEKTTSDWWWRSICLSSSLLTIDARGAESKRRKSRAGTKKKILVSYKECWSWSDGGYSCMHVGWEQYYDENEGSQSCTRWNILVLSNCPPRPEGITINDDSARFKGD